MQTTHCAHCGTPRAVYECTGCRARRYCSLSCQRADWRRCPDGHRTACAQLRASAPALSISNRIMSRQDAHEAFSAFRSQIETMVRAGVVDGVLTQLFPTGVAHGASAADPGSLGADVARLLWAQYLTADQKAAFRPPGKRARAADDDDDDDAINLEELDLTAPPAQRARTTPPPTFATTTTGVPGLPAEVAAKLAPEAVNLVAVLRDLQSTTAWRPFARSTAFWNEVARKWNWDWADYPEDIEERLTEVTEDVYVPLGITDDEMFDENLERGTKLFLVFMNAVAMAPKRFGDRIAPSLLNWPVRAQTRYLGTQGGARKPVRHVLVYDASAAEKDVVFRIDLNDTKKTMKVESLRTQNLVAMREEEQAVLERRLLSTLGEVSERREFLVEYSRAALVAKYEILASLASSTAKTASMREYRLQIWSRAPSDDNAARLAIEDALTFYYPIQATKVREQHQKYRGTDESPMSRRGTLTLERLYAFALQVVGQLFLHNSNNYYLVLKNDDPNPVITVPASELYEGTDTWSTEEERTQDPMYY